jgi:hypothetical protein
MLHRGVTVDHPTRVEGDEIHGKGFVFFCSFFQAQDAQGARTRSYTDEVLLRRREHA